MIGPSIDYIVICLYREGVFDSPSLSKGIAAVLFFSSLSFRKGGESPLSWTSIGVMFAFGMGLYIWPYTSSSAYVAGTIAGFILCGAMISSAARKGSVLASPSEEDRMESFAQCTRRIETDDSVNIPMRFRYRSRNRKGWINVVNPFRATIVMGTPGAGKSFSVYSPFIRQMVGKGYSMFVYDYKFPDLTEEVYNELEQCGGRYPVKPEFCVINFQDPRKSYRCNPIDPKYITDPADTTEIAEVVMHNVNRSAIERDDFFTQSAKVYLDALIWFLRIYRDGIFCTFPHVIELMTRDYIKVFDILKRYPELEAKIKPFSNALDGGAQEQLQGQIASAQIPLGKFVSKSLYWVLTGSDFTLDLNDPKHPKVLCVGNDPERQEIYSTTLALFTSRMFKLINHKGRLKCGVLLDELPTIYLNGLDHLIATARSNKVAIVMGVQDRSQLRRDYGDKESDVILNTVGNVFCGQVSGRTAQDMSRSFGTRLSSRVSRTESDDSQSRTVSQSREEILPASAIETFSRGVFCGKVADGNIEETLDRKFFYGEIIPDLKHHEMLKRSWKSIPLLTHFGSGDTDSEVQDELTRNFEQIQKDISDMMQDILGV